MAGTRKLLLHRETILDAAPDDVIRALNLDIAPLMNDGKLVFVRLALHAADGQELSQNFYWRAASDNRLSRAQSISTREAFHQRSSST